MSRQAAIEAVELVFEMDVVTEHEYGFSGEDIVDAVLDALKGTVDGGDIQVRHFAPQEFVQFELSSREPMQVKIAYLGQAPDGRASVAIEVRYAGDMEDDDVD